MAGCFIFLFMIIEKSYLVSPSYFYLNNYLDYNSLILTILNYLISTIAVLFFLVLFRYKPIKIKLSSIKITNSVIIALLLTNILYLYSIISIYGMPPKITYVNLVNFRYNITHGIMVFFTIFTLPFSYLLISYNSITSKKLKYFYILSFFTYMIYLFLLNSRSSLVFTILFVISIKTNFSLNNVLKDINKLNIRKTYFYALISIILVILYYVLYSKYFRNQNAMVFTLIAQRLDNFIASYMVMENKLNGYNIEYIIYPFLSLLPRSIYPQKPFPPNGDLSKILFNANLLGNGTESWSVNFGIVGESFYILNGFFIIISSFAVAISFILYKKMWQAEKLGYLKFLILTYLYTIPFNIIMAGLLTPTIGQFIAITGIYIIISLFKKGAKNA
jgi:hypothetical protein